VFGSQNVKDSFVFRFLLFCYVPIYNDKSGRAKSNKNTIIPIPQLKATRDAVRTTLSALSDFSPRWALAEEYKLVVATFKKANKKVAPSKKVVAGPRAANWEADVDTGGIH
jgi:hypothetical protein